MTDTERALHERCQPIAGPPAISGHYVCEHADEDGEPLCEKPATHGPNYMNVGWRTCCDHHTEPAPPMHKRRWQLGRGRRNA